MANSAQVVVIGGGISGLACALRLQKLGTQVTLLEANNRARRADWNRRTQRLPLRIGAAKFSGHRSAAGPYPRSGHRKRSVQG